MDILEDHRGPIQARGLLIGDSTHVVGDEKGLFPFLKSENGTKIKILLHASSDAFIYGFYIKPKNKVIASLVSTYRGDIVTFPNFLWFSEG